MPITISSLRLGGLDEALAEEVGLYDVLTVTIDDEAASSLSRAASSASGGVAILHPQTAAPPTPPLTSPSSMLRDSMPEAAADVIDLTVHEQTDQQVESVLMEVTSQDDEAAHVGVSSSESAPMPAVTGLGALAWHLSMMRSEPSASVQGDGLLQLGDVDGSAGGHDHDALTHHDAGPATATAGVDIVGIKPTTDVAIKQADKPASSGTARPRLAVRKDTPLV